VQKQYKLGRAWLFAGIVWLLLICAGSRALLNFASGPGQPGAPPERWPVASSIIPPRDRFTLVMTLHPQCTCSIATLAELQILLDRAPQKPAAYLLFHREGASSAEVASGDLWKRASAFPGVTLISDDGAQAAIFHANTSGQIMLYDPSGKLSFKGGITAARGHQGENYGLGRLLSSLQTIPTSTASAPVFGCPLHDPSKEDLEKDRSWKQR
jgi:hypothetical protein